MLDRVDIIHNPYEQDMRILINKRGISEYSSLIQYMQTPFLQWCDILLTEISKEVNNKYEVYYIGQEWEADILRIFSKFVPECESFIYCEPNISKSLQDRIKELNNWTKKNVSLNTKLELKILVIVSNKFKNIISEINEFCIKNYFLNINFVAIELSNNKINRNEFDYNIAILTNIDYWKEELSQGKIANFVLISADREVFLRKDRNILFYKYNQYDLKTALFQCLLKVPLLNLFREEYMLVNNAPEELLWIEKKPELNIPEELELGKSIPLQMEHNNIETKLSFSYDKPNIIYCNGMRIDTIQEGEVTMNVFYTGSFKPIIKKHFIVKKRNKINTLFMPYDEITIGLNDRKYMEIAISPTDADNLDKLYWDSDYPEIAEVDKKQYLVAKKVGKCIIRCIAENVYCSCVINVLPYLQDIIVVDSVELDPGEEYSINYQLDPPVAVDGNIVIETNNFFVANVINGVIIAKKPGKTTVIIKNNTGRITKNIHVHVRKNTSSKKKILNWFS